MLQVRTEGLLSSYRICNLLFTLTQVEYTTTTGNKDVFQLIKKLLQRRLTSGLLKPLHATQLKLHTEAVL